ncbi:MAG: hypothetical protein ACON5B_16650 [Myxococcota bacterium]
MQNQQVVSTFAHLVDEYERFQGFIAKAESMRERYRSEVVERVIADHASRADALLNELVPLMVDVDLAAQHAQEQVAEAQGELDTYHMRQQERDLRVLIGELDEEAARTLASDDAAALEAAEQRADALGTQKDVLDALLVRWDALGRAAGILATSDAADA